MTAVRRTKREHPRDKFDREQIARAAYFTACRFDGRGKYTTIEAPSLDAAREEGRVLGRAMIYAVTPEGWTIHVENIG